ncbi:FeoB-associated Cys-rich membrane protein [Staphylococcus edaphicus]|uniref:FeoB-associated Cys-rich membrane protein n=1 Tax=Staphylococcus edaphicus TaxID=1955013 RepID=A0A2C6WMM9_9STAP|nr:FeoB-associated Cys-rich membrane protein [Staphylococcus edaphicus]PHK48697.1 FeoB-associated Cys-rich membrane protein [Staphylococcus edaphicus]UQW81527.1 FeoB-associated Cys-rich membrane protein [Staphylococcus edaphicus]
MTLIVNILFIMAIFSYTIFTLTKFLKKSKAGKCTSCGIKDGCHTGEK